MALKVDLETLKFASLMDELAKRTLGGFVHRKKAAYQVGGDSWAWKNAIVYDGEEGMGVYAPLMWESDHEGRCYKRDSLGRTVGDCIGRDYDVTVVEDEDGQLYILVVFLNDNISNGEATSIVIRDGAWNFAGVYFQH